MTEFRGKVAVVTGAGSGIGRALAERCASEGMKVAVSDVDERALAEAQGVLRGMGATSLSVPTDVAKDEQVAELARRTVDAFGGVHLLFNNAGVAAGGAPWESTREDWEWVIGVNLWGVINGVRHFVPIMLGQHSEAHIVNTASIAGILEGHPSAPYQVTKHAVVALSENLHRSLTRRGAEVHASVLCPGWVNTRIAESARNRPRELRSKPQDRPRDPHAEARGQRIRGLLASAMEPARVADVVFDAIKRRQFYIFTDLDEHDPYIRTRLEDILNVRNPGDHGPPPRYR